MGQASGCATSAASETSASVNLNIYDVGGHDLTKGVNNLFRAVGTGAFHSGVEIFGQELCYGYCENGTGVCMVAPRSCPPHSYRETIYMGETPLSRDQVDKAVIALQAQWPGSEYDLLGRNCCHFADALCRALQVGPIPPWVTNLAGAGATLQHGALQAYEQGGKAFDHARSAAIIAAAKAGELDQKYQINGTVRAKASDLMKKAGEVDAQRILQSAGAFAQDVGRAAVTGAQTAHARALAIDQKHGISKQANEHATRLGESISAAVTDATTRLQAHTAPRPAATVAGKP
mmetsp:Transcript_97420/g.281072  ORF Transcript_97420/g.281072 Transcript_97420/m.281072 type:complete len:290 (+) Transcript_97420:110-979(+)|eukprot:CAMPEP_0176080672 /NCGR_PEP_ID=MMETSP0120_2-20121206/40353_1 /TAXON_ID=160619 /ORGANISM="Kryptoperidinium foliaceum, Strain CCMP 1326" /LENGTH=289 /DNA_ID=CAMNT_0017414439 /DNA_START=102 /DNA_END=971 /DNA_ORIENTATION=-